MNSCFVTKSSYLDCLDRGSRTLTRLNHALWRSILGRGQDVRGREEAKEPDRVPAHLVDAPLFPIDDTDRGTAAEARFAERLDGRQGRTARGDDVLDETDALARVEGALEPLVRGVALRVLADDQERQS